ncbi:hypothetical protein B0H66DRAFT_97208 [Apodospora peruviana]|uniref:NACHT domain-containing protein n=1 Tax=Apodospora peruviana TaxID=516989 RepID=A0AAE0MG90_9PEZI|nr:hypothetical protein B0H66DRAFT_97208 [Apodospora peruviana]
MSTALSQAASLKPDIRLAQALSEFCASLNDARANEFKALRTRSPPTPADVIKLTEEINRDGSRAHKTWRPYATSMALFLDKVQTLSRIGDLLLGASQNLMATGIWAAVKVTLGIAVGSLTFFRRISELFLKVGRSSHITEDLVHVFPGSKELQDLMCEYLITLVSFCQKIVQVLNKPTLIRLTSPFIAFFDKEALKFEDDLTRWSTAIDRRSVVLLSHRQVESADTITKISRTLTQWAPTSDAKKQQALMLRSERLQKMLCPRQEVQQRIAAWRRQRKKGTSNWLFQNTDYLKWKTFEGFSTLWIRGKLGSGKTVLMANLVAELYSLCSPVHAQKAAETTAQTPPILAYFFCNSDYANSNTYEKVVGSIFQQFLALCEPGSKVFANLDEHLKRSSSSPLDTETRSIIRNALPKNSSLFIVLDAIDECDPSVVVRILSAVRQLIFLGESPIHLCFSTRTDAPINERIGTLFSEAFTITMTPSTLSSEMHSFIDAEFERRQHIRRLDKSLEEIIKAVLVEASEGMYLWVALQIEALFPLHNTTLISPADILKLLEQPPKDLDEAFNRALRRITDTRYGKAIFQLVAGARRPLTLAELRIALHVQPGETDWSAVPLSLPPDARAIIGLCGGGLLEIEEEDDTVRFIHHSVLQYLLSLRGHRITDAPTATALATSDYHFYQGEADILLGSVCVTYLHYGIFNTSLGPTSPSLVISTDQITNHVASLVATTSSEANMASKIVATIKRSRVSSAQQQELNIGQMLQRYLEPKVDADELLVFSDYAHENWLWHANFLWTIHESKVYTLFQSLLRSPAGHVTWPFDPNRAIVHSPSNQMRWAWLNSHFGILFDYLSISPNSVDVALSKLFEDTYRDPWPWSPGNMMRIPTPGWHVPKHSGLRPDSST